MLLPPVRELAGMLKVSSATAAAAYRLLHARGLVSADRRRGTRVRSATHIHRPATRARSAPTDDLIDLASGNPDPRLLPGLAAAYRGLPYEPVMYGRAAESRALVSFARAELAAEGIAVDELLVTSGALDAIERVLREHVRAGDRVVLEDPCYPALHDLVVGCGYAVEPIEIDGHGPKPESFAHALARRPAAVILTPRGQNPTGAAVTRERAEEIHAILKRDREVLLIENDPFGPVAGVPVITMTPGRQRWAIVRSTSKFLGPDLRVAILAGDTITLARVRGRQAVGVRWVSHLLQNLAVALWSDPASGRQLARAADTYARRRTAFVKALAAYDVQVTAVSGFNVWIPVRHETAVAQRLSEAGWAVAPGEQFRLRSGPGIRVTTSALEPDASERFARDLSEALRTGSPDLA
jgi:DNA-binding transcriptional MocR family regulator